MGGGVFELGNPEEGNLGGRGGRGGGVKKPCLLLGGLGFFLE